MITNCPPRPQIEFPAFLTTIDIVSVVALETPTLVLELTHVRFAQILEKNSNFCGKL